MDILAELINVLTGYGRAALQVLPAIVIAIGVLVGFWFLAGLARRGAESLSKRITDDTSLQRLAGTSARILVSVLGLFTAAAIVFPGLDAGDLISVLGLTSVAVGFAFKDIFQNFLAGIIILTQRPFVIGDQIEGPDVQGTVQDISIRATEICTFDGRTIIIPNSALFTEAVTVNTAQALRRTTFSTGIGYDEDIEHARRVIGTALEECDLVVSNPAPQVHVVEHGGSSINFDIRYWSKSDQASVNSALDQVATSIKYALDDAHIEIPFPQHTLHLESLPEFLIERGEDDEEIGLRSVH